MASLFFFFYNLGKKMPDRIPGCGKIMQPGYVGLAPTKKTLTVQAPQVSQAGPGHAWGHHAWGHHTLLDESLGLHAAD